MPESNRLLLATLEFDPNYFTARFFIDEQLRPGMERTAQGGFDLRAAKA